MTEPTTQVESATTHRFRRAAAVIAIVLGVLAAVGYGAWRHHFPYGWSHCCDLQLGMALRQYAEIYNGFLPAGEKTPEASLSLLHGADLANANLLRGKIVSESAVQERLDKGQRLTPETCGWHYVEGLRDDDDGRIAVLWDKVGLDHNGGLLPAGSHTILYLIGGHDTIPAAKWSNFLDEQQKRIAASKAARGDKVKHR
jgi:hypothetical protein